ncbi:MAG: serine hydrolase domain-containing protein [Bacteroidota bacterium]
MQTKYTYIITYIALLLLNCTSSNQSDSNRNDQHQLQELQAFLNERAEKDSLHGVVLIGVDDKIIFQEAYGYVDLAKSQQHTTESQIGLASVGKMFTAIAIMQLNAQGKLQLDDLASKYLDDLENSALRDSVKIKHLLSHTSGLGSYWGELRESNARRSPDVDYIYSLVKDDTLAHPIGKEFHYSNSGFIVLGKIIQEVSGMFYRDYVTENIFNPCKMTHTKIGASAGGGTSTIQDMWKFGQALKTRKLLRKEQFQLMLEDYYDADYGYGMMVSDNSGNQAYGHNGGSWDGEKMGVASSLFIINEKYTAIILTNRNPNVGGIGFEVQAFLTKK